MYRILYLGNDWYGSCARACGYALRRLGHEVIDVSADGYSPVAKRLFTRAVLRATSKLLEREFNEQVLATARKFEPDLLLTFKGCLLRPETLRRLRKEGLPLYQYYPDNSVFAHRTVHPETMAEYDCCFFTKRFSIADTMSKMQIREAIYLPHGYDPDVHRVPELTQRDKELYSCGVAAVMTHTIGKERFLNELLTLRPDLPLQLWGDGWSERCRSANVMRKAVGRSIMGQAYVKVMYGAKINLALLSEQARGASSGDQTSTRSYEIPACGGFMLHQRTEEVRELFEEGREIACFDSAGEALQKIDYYLAHDREREEIALRGHRRAVPAYSYDARMQFILDYHRQHRPLWHAVGKQGAAG